MEFYIVRCLERDGRLSIDMPLSLCCDKDVAAWAAVIYYDAIDIFFFIFHNAADTSMPLLLLLMITFSFTFI